MVIQLCYLVASLENQLLNKHYLKASFQNVKKILIKTISFCKSLKTILKIKNKNLLQEIILKILKKSKFLI